VARGKSVPRPWKQSSVDRFCGIVVCLNLLRTVAPFLNWNEGRELYAVGMEYLLRRGYFKRVIREGMGDRQNLELLFRLCREAKQRYAVRLNIQRPYRKRTKSMPIEIFAIEAARFLSKPNRGILVYFETLETAHLTVICAVTRSSFLLSDSADYTRLPFKSCSTAPLALKRGYRYRIDVGSVIFASLYSSR
jgi:hypothetical protein